MTDINKLGELYKSEFTEHQLFVMKIAMEQLGSSFNIVKSNGFKKWLQKYEEKQKLEIEEKAKPVPEPESNPPKKKKKIVIKKKKSPKNNTETQNNIESKNKIIDSIDNVLTEEWKDIRSNTEPFIMSNETISNLLNNSCLYCLFTTETLLYVGTTTDTKKNLPIAYRNCKKNQNKLNEQEVYAIVLLNDNNKQRIKMRDLIKKNLLNNS